jgi:hypothetical protein
MEVAYALPLRDIGLEDWPPCFRVLSLLYPVLPLLDADVAFIVRQFVPKE